MEIVKEEAEFLCIIKTEPLELESPVESNPNVDHQFVEIKIETKCYDNENNSQKVYNLLQDNNESGDNIKYFEHLVNETDQFPSDGKTNASSTETTTGNTNNGLATTKRARKKGKRSLPIGDIQYVCSVCNETFGKPDDLKAHASVQHPKVSKIFKCSQCPKVLARADSLATHIRMCHLGTRHTCNICQKQFDWENSLKVHIQAHKGERNYKCTECPKDFLTRSGLKVHLRLHAGEKNYVCSECGMKFVTGSGLTAHSRVHTGEKPYECKQCSMAFRSRSSFVLHKKLKHGEGGGRKRHRCFHCQDKFQDFNSLKKHIESHVELKNVVLVCDKCSEVFNDINAHLRHMYAKHVDKTLFSCNECNRRFPALKHLNKHMQKEHLNETVVEDYSIKQECFREFMQGEGSEIQLKGTDGDSRVFCTKCNKYFVNARRMRSHILNVHIRPFKCTECPKSFGELIKMNIHKEIVHEGRKRFCCEFCPNRYVSVVDLKNHVRIHTKEKPYFCDICEKGFRWKTNFRDHMELHKTRNIKCDNCDKQFVSTRDLKIHVCNAQT